MSKITTVYFYHYFELTAVFPGESTSAGFRLGPSPARVPEQKTLHIRGMGLSGAGRPSYHPTFS